MSKVKVKVFSEDGVYPKYESNGAAGMDVSSKESYLIDSGETKLIKTGLYFQIPPGYEIQVRPRSGLSLKTGLRVANAPGTIDSDYRGELCIIMSNISNSSYQIKLGERVAQIVLKEVPQIEWDIVDTKDNFDSTERGEKGFGSTGK